jgi:hypothetical protein
MSKMLLDSITEESVGKMIFDFEVETIWVGCWIQEWKIWWIMTA